MPGSGTDVPENQISLVVFDLGGVLLRLRDARTTFGLDADNSSFIRTWLKSESVRQFERGEIGDETFAQQVVQEMELPYDHSEFLQRFGSWPDGMYQGIPELLERIPDHIGTALLSNTNALHWNQGSIDETLRSRIDHLFLSYESGLLKPDEEAFVQVLEHFSRAPQEVLFLDDNPLNIAAAKQLGITARLTRGEREVREILEAERLLVNFGQ
jgi:FMN phosphatase YigB (HAD superfamily)